MIIGETTLSSFLNEHKDIHKENNPGLYIVLAKLADGVKGVSFELKEISLTGLTDTTGKQNLSGDRLKGIDLWSNALFVKLLLQSNRVALIYSEESDGAIYGCQYADNLVCLDPLDGSSLVNSNTTIGSIFSVYQTTPDNNHGFCHDDSCLLNLRDQVCSGYGLYGPATLLVLAFQDGVYEFTQVASGDFVLSGDKLKLPANGAATYSINEGHAKGWSCELAKVINFFKEQNYSSRYAGALVTDFHRTLKEGGVFIYPATAKHPLGKLRLFYEAAPLAFIMEQAGGFAVSSPGNHILDIKAKDIHSRTPFMFGHLNELKVLSSFLG